MRTLLLLLVLVAAAAGGALAVRAGLIGVPDRWNPWAPLRIDEELHWFTRLKLMRLSSDPELCRAVLAQAQMRYTALEDRDTGAGCGFRNAVKVTATSAQLAQPFSASCRLAVSLALWEHHVLQPAAQAHFGTGVQRLEHFGSYSCRDIGGRSGRRSQHATADALDVAGFVLADGRRIRIARDWNGGGEEARFLREVHGRACAFFGSALGPEYNAAHRDHFHFDRGRWGICR